jgi:signal transduction histidine kinase/ligand-binding sensor domain-containing protein
VRRREVAGTVRQFFHQFRVKESDMPQIIPLQGVLPLWVNTSILSFERFMRILQIGWLLLFCWVLSASAQEYAYSVRNYKAVDGLPQSQVNIMLEDKNGYLWIGTQGGGLARFDGRKFTVYTTLDGLLSNIISYLKLDDDQNLWIVHPRGITKFDGIHFTKFRQSGSPLNARRIRRIFEYRDTLFFTSGQGDLGKIYRDSVYYWARPFAHNLLVRYCHLNPDREIMMYLSDSTFFVRSHKGDYVLSHKHVFNRLQAMFNYDRKVWMRTDSGFFNVDFQNREFVRNTLPVRNHVLFYDAINDVFWTRYGNHLLKEKITEGSVKVDTVLSDIDVTQVLVDSEGNTWFATAGTGLYKYFIQDFDRCSSENMKGVWAILKDRSGATWVGSNTKGLWKIHKGKIHSYVDNKESYRNEVYCIAESPDGTIWAGTGYGLGKYHRETDSFTWYTRDNGLSNASIWSIEFDETGKLWIGTFSGGVNHFDGTAFKAYTIRDGLSSNTIYASHYSMLYKTLFVGNEFGVSTIVGGRVQSLGISGIENTSVTSINAYQDSLLLIGTGGAGVAVFNPRTHYKKILTTHLGLASDFIYFVAPDQENYIWIGTEKGITRIRLNHQQEIVENLHYDYDNGLTGVETNFNAFHFAQDKKYFGLIDGVYKFNDLKQDGRRSFDLHLTDIQLSYGEYSIRNYSDSLMGFFKIPYDPQLPPEKNHITFHFNRVDKRYPKSVRFKYFLENFDKTWSQPSFNTEVTYGNLPPGKYVFRVMSTDNQGSWSPAHAYAFTVKTPFYQTASFIVGMFILFAGAVTLVLYLRVKQRVNQVMVLERIRAKEQETLRKEIARDFHDEMGNQLTRIINYVSLLKLNGNGNENGHDLYTKVEDSAKYLYTGTRDFIWSIDPGNDELSKLFIHIRDFGEKLFEEKNISFRAFNEVKEKTKLPYGFSREANLIFKEAMTNAFKYSGAGNVTFSLNREKDGFEMCLEDDGVGFYTGDVQKSNGLKNIRERADRIQAVLRIQSIKHQGTKIVLNFKLNKTLKYGLAF